jgi:hypothetical protein
MDFKNTETKISFYTVSNRLKKTFLVALIYRNINFSLQINVKNLLFNKIIKTDNYLSVFFL